MRPIKVVEHQDAVLWGKGAVGLKDGKTIRGTHLERDDMIPDDVPGWIVDPGHVSRSIHSVATLTTIWSRNYFHWVLESLPQAAAYMKHLAASMSSFLVPARPPRYITRSLEMLEVPTNVVWDWDGIPTFVGRLFTTSAPREDGHNYVPALTELRERMRASAGVSAERVRRLYVSRGLKGERSVVNELDLMPLLEGWGFTVVIPETLDFDEQVKLFSAAEIIMGPHGAGLVNAMWSDSCIIVELNTPSAKNECFEKLAGDLGYPHVLVQCSEAFTSDEMLGMTVNTRALNAALGEMASRGMIE